MVPRRRAKARRRIHYVPRPPDDPMVRRPDITLARTALGFEPRIGWREGLSETLAGFGMAAEITGKLLRRGIRPYEVPISYKARTREAGKKLTWRDGVGALLILVRERFAPRRVSATSR